MSNSMTPMLAQYESGEGGGGGIGGLIFMLVYLAVIVLVIAGAWKMFVKAGRPGWEAIIPIYSGWVFCKIAGRPGWWVFLCLIPLVGIVVAIIVCLDFAKAFGKGAGFGVGLALLGFIFVPILGFGSAQFKGAAPMAIPGAPPAAQ